MSSGPNPYILFLILILLVFGTDPEAAKKAETFKNIIDRVTTTVNNFKAGINTMTTDFGEIHLMLQGLEKPSGEPQQ